MKCLILEKTNYRGKKGQLLFHVSVCELLPLMMTVFKTPSSSISTLSCPFSFVLWAKTIEKYAEFADIIHHTETHHNAENFLFAQNCQCIVKSLQKKITYVLLGGGALAIYDASGGRD